VTVSGLTRDTPAYVDRVHVMGTVVVLDVRAATRPADFDTAVEAAADRLAAIDESFSPWLHDSWVSRLLRGDVPVEDCPAEVRLVVETAERLADVTGGYFTPRWRGGTGPDPTGLVKGWAAQQASDVLLSHGLDHHVVNAAGDLVVSGSPTGVADGTPWRIGISDPSSPGALAGVVERIPGAHRWALATSGTAELGRHVADPHTGTFPGSVAAATVVTDARTHREAGAVADACATALVAAGDQAARLLARLPRVDGFVLHADGRVSDPGGLLLPAP
jgi:thiamine biosynthesis lipoprotein